MVSEGSYGVNINRMLQNSWGGMIPTIIIRFLYYYILDSKYKNVCYRKNLINQKITNIVGF